MKFDIKDVRGIRVLCTKECWDNHILDEHPIMADADACDHVIEAIQLPLLFIYQDRTIQNATFTIRKINLGLDIRRQW